MSEIKSENVRSKMKKKKKSKKKFLLTSKKYWLMEEELIPMYQHLVDGYFLKLREHWTVEVEVLDVNILSQVKEEPVDDNLAVGHQHENLLEPQPIQQYTSSTPNQPKVTKNLINKGKRIMSFFTLS